MNRRKITPRKHFRIETEMEIRWSPQSCGDIEVAMLCSDLSKGGMKLTTHKEPVVGTYINIYFKAGRHTVGSIIPAEIIWTKPHGKKSDLVDVGIKFLFLDEEQEGIIKDFITRKKAHVIVSDKISKKFAAKYKKEE
jgi:Tfp pilus assembly protein PilZ